MLTTLIISYIVIGMFVSIFLNKDYRGADAFEHMLLHTFLIIIWPVIMIGFLFSLPGFIAKYISQKIWPEKKSNDYC
jgi:hypothetical protein